MGHQKRYLFHPTLERIYFSLMFVFTGIVIYSFSVEDTFWNKEGVWQTLIVRLVFLNWIHSLVGLFIMSALPEFRALCRGLMRGPMKWRIIAAISAIIVAELFWESKKTTPTIDAGVLGFVFLAVFTMRKVHNIGQTKGLSLLFNRLSNPGLSVEQKLKQERVEKAERTLFNIFIVVLVGLVALRFAQINWALPTNPVYVAVLAVLALMLVVNSWRYPNVNTTNKGIFMLGMFFHVTAAFSVAGLAMQRALHGLEYCFLSWNIIKNSKVKIKRGAILILATLVFYAVGSIAISYSSVLPFGEVSLNSSLFRIFLFLSFFLDFFHYYADSVLFHFKDPLVREHVGPLLGLKEEPNISSHLFEDGQSFSENSKTPAQNAA